MKPFVVLLGTAAFLGFSWVSWSTLRGPIENQLTTTAQSALNEAGLDDVQIKFDHLDGVVSGVQTAEMETKVREIVLSTIPTGRLVFEQPPSDSANSTTEQHVDHDALANEISATDTASDAPNETPATPLDALAASDDEADPATVAQLDTLESHDNPDETSRFMDAIGEPGTAPETLDEPLEPADELAADTNPDYTVDVEDLTSDDESELLNPLSDSDQEESPELLAGDGSEDAPETISSPAVDDATTEQSISEDTVTSIGNELPTIDAPANPLSLNEPTDDTDIASWDYEEVADSATEIPGDPDTAAEPNADPNAAPKTTALTNGLDETQDPDSNENSLASEIPPAIVENNDATQLLNQATSTNEEATEDQEASNAVEPLGLQPSDDESLATLESVSDASSFEPADETTLSATNPEVDINTDTEVTGDANADGEIPSNTTLVVTEDGSIEVTETAPLEDATQPLPAADAIQTPTQLEQADLEHTDDELPTIESPQANLTPEANATVEANSTPATKTTPATASATDADSAPQGPRPRFGVYLSNNPNDPLVRVVAPGSAAANADIRVGDSIVRFGIRNVSSFEDLSRAVMEKAGGDQVPVWVMRKGELLRKSVKLQSASAPLPPVRAPITSKSNTRNQ